MTIHLGTKEEPVRVNCDVSDRYRYLYVRVIREQQQLSGAFQTQEGETLQDFNDRGANL